MKAASFLFIACLNLKIHVFRPYFVVVQAAIVNSQTLEEVARLEKVLSFV